MIIYLLIINFCVFLQMTSSGNNGGGNAAGIVDGPLMLPLDSSTTAQQSGGKRVQAKQNQVGSFKKI
jgi:hypothetical protein